LNQNGYSCLSIYLWDQALFRKPTILNTAGNLPKICWKFAGKWPENNSNNPKITSNQ
jgi:hypothetical protein